jgi:hypothetical protein
MMRTLLVAAALSALAVEGAAPVAAAEQGQSTQLAKQLVTLMSERKLEAIAAPDPQNPDRFVAAMAYPGVQLLVMAAQTTAPDYMRWQLAQKKYSDVYAALQQGVPDSKIFFQDLGCDGLPLGEDQTPDVMYQRGSEQVIFDGNWKSRKMSEGEYRKKLQDADAQYSRLLTVLVGALQAAE